MNPRRLDTWYFIAWAEPRPKETPLLFDVQPILPSDSL